jgi:co-chaperonin GroES (HSP10)
VKVGDVVFCNVISGSQGANDQFSSIDGVKFTQMPTKDVMAVLE